MPAFSLTSQPPPLAPGLPVGSPVAVTTVLNAPFAWKAGLRRFFYCTVVYTLKYYPAEPYNNWRVYLRYLPHIHPWSRLDRKGVV